MCKYCEVAKQIINGQGGWGNAPERWRRLEAAGYNWKIVEDIVNTMIGPVRPPRRIPNFENINRNNNEKTT